MLEYEIKYSLEPNVHRKGSVTLYAKVSNIICQSVKGYSFWIDSYGCFMVLKLFSFCLFAAFGLSIMNRMINFGK